MSLEKIQLPPFVIHDLFKNCVVELNTNELIPITPENENIQYMGNNKQQVVVAFRNTHTSTLTDDELNFLTGILLSCKLTLDDIALINIAQRPGLNYHCINKELAPRIVILFGFLPMIIDLPFQVPLFQLQNFEAQLYLAVPSLTDIQRDTTFKKHLWLNLKQLFKV